MAKEQKLLVRFDDLGRGYKYGLVKWVHTGGRSEYVVATNPVIKADGTVQEWASGNYHATLKSAQEAYKKKIRMMGGN